jgi:hypothetical protein
MPIYVISRHKGMVSYYSVQLGPDGSPQLHVLAPPMPTTDADGLEVSFPVKREDIIQFQRAADTVSVGFSVPPTITNSKEKAFTPVKRIYEGKDYYLYEHESMRGAYAQMGCVLYPIPSQYLDYANRNIVYKFDIGDLEVTASREALSFGPNDPTEANIRLKAGVVEANIFDVLQKEIDAQPKLFLAAKLAPKLRRFVMRGGDFKYRGQQIPKIWSLGKYSKISLHCGYKNYRQKLVGFGLDKDLQVSDEYTIFVQDTSDKKGCARAGQRISTAVGSHKYYLWVRLNLADAEQKAELDAMITELDYPVTYVKDLPDDGPKQSGPRSKIMVSILDRNTLSKWDMSDEVFQQGGYYYPMSNNEYPSMYHPALGFIQKKFSVHNVTMVPKTLWKKFEAADNWKLLAPALEAAVLAEEPKVRLALGRQYNMYPMMYFGALEPAGGPVGEFAKNVKTTSSTYMGLDRSAWDAVLGYYGRSPIGNEVAESEFKAILDRYPLLKLFIDRQKQAQDFIDRQKQAQDFIDYIKLIDNAAKE